MKLNVNAVLKQKAERDAMEKPLPKIKIRSSGYRSEIVARILAETPPEVTQRVREYGDNVMKQHQAELLYEMRVLKKDRAKLSTKTFFLVNEIYERLKKDSPARADQFMDSQLSVPELTDHAASIESLTQQIIRVWDKIRHVDQYGKLPAEKQISLVIGRDDSDQVKVLSLDIRRLSQSLSKTRRKLETGKPLNIERKAFWNEKIVLIEAHILEKKSKLSKLQYEARAERIGQ